MKLPTHINEIPIPLSTWKLSDVSGKTFELEVQIDFQGILHFLARRALKNKTSKASAFSGMIRAKIL